MKIAVTIITLAAIAACTTVSRLTKQDTLTAITNTYKHTYTWPE